MFTYWLYLLSLDCVWDHHYHTVYLMVISCCNHCLTLYRVLLLQFVPLPFIYSITFINMNSLIFRSLVIMQYCYFITALAIRSSFKLAPMYLWYLSFLSEHLLDFWHQRWSRIISYFPYPSSRINQFFKEPWFLLLKNYNTVQDLGIRYAHC